MFYTTSYHRKNKNGEHHFREEMKKEYEKKNKKKDPTLRKCLAAYAVIVVGILIISYIILH